MQQRRTFAIISHPDAGKTTLTEKILLEGGAIHTAGEVKARGEGRQTHSDWLEIERKRGISIASSVMTFEYNNTTFNLLDTPGHQDFSEDTYRTLTAVDSAVMVLDAAKGIESQTLKLFEVCRLRNIPMITFINKMDREARDPFDLLEEIEKKLALDVCPLYWPIGMGKNFKGCYSILSDMFCPFKYSSSITEPETIPVEAPSDERLLSYMSSLDHQNLIENLNLLEAAGTTFNSHSYLQGHLTPVYFGSALRNFGVHELLNGLCRFAPGPNRQRANTRDIMPNEDKTSGFVFKIQANMDPNHRDRVAFVRLCSGTFKRGMKLKHVRTGKFFAVHNPVFFLARERSLTEEAYPGDIIGIPNHGTLRIGDTLTEGENLHVQDIPSFAPEILRQIRIDDPMRVKHLRKALEDLAEEGVSQLFKPMLGSNWLVGVVGQLQLEVLASRVEAEYRIKVAFETCSFETARWVSSEDPEKLKEFIEGNRSQIAEDQYGRPVYLARNSWDLNHTEEKWKVLKFHKVREQIL
ncbi:MAG TPA: peptide chain release factor 3 [Candidatus Nitrosotenuis sp.]|jgi:peptide chain release factor 3|nr:peptide chain release factor 3 [Candidatus Nitrosotenuis sp.]